jgi:hypothetical protein
MLPPPDEKPLPPDRLSRFGDDGGPDGFLVLDPDYDPDIDEDEDEG